MAGDSLFDQGRAGFLAGEIDWDTANITVALTRGYTFSNSHKFVSDATTAGATLVSTVLLGTKTTTAGVADAADVVFSAVPTGTACSCVLIYQSSAVGGGADVASSAQRLIAYIDSATGLPVTPNGGSINLNFDNGTNKIFKL